MPRVVRIGLEEIGEYFESLDDPRSDINQKHPFVSVIVIAVMAVLAGADGPTAIARWAALKAGFLVKHLDLPHGAPKKDVFLRVLRALKPEAFQTCFGEWLEALRSRAQAATGVTRPVLSVDGKTLRRSHDRGNGLGPLHAVSVWAAEYGMTLAQVACAEKSNEITAIPELLRLVSLKGAIITIDAMGTQTAIAKQIVDGGADYVLALKGNQSGLHQSVMAYVNHHQQRGFRGIGARRHVTEETGHGREERREYIQFPVPADLPDRERWSGLKTLGVATLTCRREGKPTSETRYFLSSLPMGVKQFAHAVRSHWAIENSCHWSLDFTYREDESRHRDRRLRENFAWLNRFTLSLLKQHPARISQSMKRQSCGWNENFLLEVLTSKTT